MSDASAVTFETQAPHHQASAIQLTLRQITGLVAYTLREALHRWTLVTYALGVSFFLLLMATAVNLDIVEGTLASARLFGQDLEIGGMGIQISDVVRWFHVIVISTLYMVGIGLALFLTSQNIPAIAREGWVDLLAAQPISRPVLLLGRTLGSLTVVTINLAYLVIGSWFVLSLKTGFAGAGLLFAGLTILFTYAVCYSATVLVGIITRNGLVSGMIGIFVWVAGHALYPLHSFSEWRVAIRAGWPRQLITGITEGLYWLLPKNQGLWQVTAGAARGEPVSLAPIWYSLPFAGLCLFLACWWFSSRDY